MQISIFKNKESVKTVFDRDVSVFFERIKLGSNKVIIDKIRKAKTKKEADELKGKLPGCTFSGTFSQRNSKSLTSLSGLTCLDFDKFETFEDAISFKTNLIKDKYVMAAFISPSGKGIKAIIKIPKDLDNYSYYHKALIEYFNSPNTDNSVHDISRLCFESYDSDIFINYDSKLWDKLSDKEAEDLGEKEVVIPLRSEVGIIDKLLVWFNKKYTLNTGERNNNLFKLASSFNSFGVNKSDALNTCLKYQSKDFTANEIEKIVNSAYRNTASFGTKFFEDTVTKNKIHNAIKSGKNEKKIREEFKNIPKEQLEQVISSFTDNTNIDEYWSYSQSGNVILSHHKYKKFLEGNNFYKFYPSGSDNFIFVKINENIIEDTNSNHIKDFVLTDLQKRENIGIAPFDFMASATRYFKEDYLSFLATAEVKLKEDTERDCFIYFKNCCLQISKDNAKIKTIDYIDLDGYVWKKQIINREFKVVDYNSSMFKQFVWLISGQKEERFNSVISVIGYLLHGFKTSATNKAIIFNDETISDNPNGGSGKGIFCNAISQLKRAVFIDGKMFEFNKSFAYQTVSADTQVLVFDDVRKNFAFENLFSLITEGITLEKKNKDAIKIGISKSPKVVITTNYTIGGIGGSFERRKFEIELSSYFNAQHTPLNEFKCLLFDEWDELEWSMFDNFMIYCVKYYLDNGLVKSDYNNLDVRKFIKETSYEFYEWVNDEHNLSLKVGERVYKAAVMSEFIKEYKDAEKWLTQKKFGNWLKSYAILKKYKIREGKSIEGRFIEFIENEG